ncbi:MAG TPA: homocysteine S-methyltransferase family protein [Nannocystaceae bacterium]|nr:homocysteine S-methyltransferase family protein [Nannocystaceae bacterium]
MLLDGAVGTELERHGFPLRGPRWSAAAIDEAPALLEEIHRSYVEAGAEVITTATTCAHPWFVGERAAATIERAVGIARAAIADAPRPVTIAGSLAMLPASVDMPTRIREYAATAAALHSAGVDVLLFEAFTSTAELARAVEAAADVAGQRWLALVVREDGATLTGDDPRGALALPADAWLVHCCSVPAAAAALSGLRERGGAARLGAYPARAADLPDATFAAELDALRQRFDLGIVGACCGSTPATIAAVGRGLAAAR